MAADVDRKYCDGSRSHSWNSSCLADRLRPNLAEALNDLSRQPRHSRIAEVPRDGTMLVAGTSPDFSFLTSEIALVFQRSLDTRDIESADWLTELESTPHEPMEPGRWLTQPLLT